MPTNLIDVKGFDLKIDPNVQKLCEVSNASSGTSRGVLYVLLLICIICIISVINSFSLPDPQKQGEKYNFFGIHINHDLNWVDERTEFRSGKYKKIQDSINYYETLAPDSLREAVKTKLYVKELKNKRRLIEEKLQALAKSESENMLNVKIPIIGNSFDLNNLSIFTGVSFMLVLIVLWVTVRREKKNLRIALHAVSDRYPDVDDLTKCLIINDVTTQLAFEKDSRKRRFLSTEFLNNFNLTRRKHHYNFLSMNEMYTVPYDLLDREPDKYSFRTTFFGKVIVKYFYSFPFLVYLFVFSNDLLSINAGLNLSASHTIIQTFQTFACLIVIGYFCEKCNREKVTAQAYYDDFRKNNFIFNKFKSEDSFLKDSNFNPLTFCIILAATIFIYLGIILYLLYQNAIIFN